MANVILFNGETIQFNTYCECDWCYREKWCGVTHYGTTHYNRLICKKCAKEISRENMDMFGFRLYEVRRGGE